MILDQRQANILTSSLGSTDANSTTVKNSYDFLNQSYGDKRVVRLKSKVYWDTPLKSRHPPGADTLGADPRSRHTPVADPPAQCTLGDTGNKRAVCILLKCILVV